MNETRFDTVVRQAAERLSRRHSFVALGSVGLAALAGSPVTQARKKKPKRKCPNIQQRARRLVAQTCGQQVPQCQAGLPATGATPQFLVCCPLLSDCNVSAFFQCIAALTAP